MKALVIAGVSLRRMVRYRPNLFFMVLFPLLLILVIGATFGGSFEPRLGVVVQGTPGPLAQRLVDALAEADGYAVDRLDDEDALRTAVERGSVSGGLVIPASYDQALRTGRAELRYLSRPDESGQQVGIAVRAAVDEQAAVVRAARFAQQQTGTPFDLALQTAGSVNVPPISVRATTVGDALFPATLGRFDLGASSELLLFTFLTSLAASGELIEALRLGVGRRMFAAPVGAGTILAGVALGRIAIALVQGLIIMLGSALLFGVSWGDPLGAAAVLLAFSLVAGGAAMLAGALFRTDQQAGGFGVMLGLGFAAIGGSMVPLELFSPTMRAVAHITPHAWGADAFAELVRRGGSIVDIAPQLGVLLGYAAVLLLLGTWLLRRRLRSAT
jgi:ABC-2 type transport system permease protein